MMGRALARLSAWAVAGWLLAACGGSGDFEPAPVVAPPPQVVPEPPPVDPAPPPVTQVPDPPAAPVTDPQRGARLFATPSAAGQLPCMDCHSSDPVLRNFGNIWAARNAPFLIERAMVTNTGGMGSLRPYFSAQDIADIAAYIGNSPTELVFAATPVGATSTALSVLITSSTKVGIDHLSITVQGAFQRSGGTCANLVARFSSCTVDIVFRPTAAGAASGSVLIRHSETVNPVRILLSGSTNG
jgi:mono/diheme cytochrome c family protein